MCLPMKPVAPVTATVVVIVESLSLVYLTGGQTFPKNCLRTQKIVHIVQCYENAVEGSCDSSIRVIVPTVDLFPHLSLSRIG